MSETAVVPPAPPAPPAMNAVERLLGVFFEPGKTFADIARSPGFIAPLVLLAVVALVANQVITRKVGLENIVRKEIMKNPRTAEMPKERMDQAVEMGMTIGRYTSFLVPVFVPLACAAVAGLVLVITNFVLGGSAKYVQMLAAMAHAWVPAGLVQQILAIVVVFLKDPADVDVSNMLSANLGVLISAETSKFLNRFAQSLDLFSFWTIALMAFGIAACTRFSFTKSALVVVVPWLVWVLGASAIAAAF